LMCSVLAAWAVLVVRVLVARAVVRAVLAVLVVLAVGAGLEGSALWMPVLVVLVLVRVARLVRAVQLVVWAGGGPSPAASFSALTSQVELRVRGLKLCLPHYCLTTFTVTRVTVMAFQWPSPGGSGEGRGALWRARSRSLASRPSSSPAVAGRVEGHYVRPGEREGRGVKAVNAELRLSTISRRFGRCAPLSELTSFP